MWTPPIKTLKLTAPTASMLRRIVRASYPLALKVKLALSVSGDLAPTVLTPAEKTRLSNGARELYKYIPAYEVPLATAQSWVNGATWVGAAPILDNSDRRGWATFADEELLLRLIHTLTPVLALPPAARNGAMPANLSLADLKPAIVQTVDPAAVAAYRADRMKLWQSLQSAYKAYVEAAMKPINECIAKQAEQPGLKCPDKGAALTAAGKSVRGDVRSFVHNLLPHVPQQAAVNFILGAPKGWGVDSEILLDDKSVPVLIDVALHNSVWVQDQDDIDKAKAALDGTFKDWMTKSMTRLDAAASGAGEILKKGADTAFGVVADVGKGVGTGLKELGAGAGGFLKNLPLVIGVVVGGVVVVGGIAYVATRKK